MRENGDQNNSDYGHFLRSEREKGNTYFEINTQKKKKKRERERSKHYSKKNLKDEKIKRII